MTVELIIPTGINIITAVNRMLVTAKRRGETPNVTLPNLRERAKAAVHESNLLKIETLPRKTPVGELTP